MNVIFLMLLIAFFIISVIPETKEDTKNIKDINRLRRCLTPHSWAEKQVKEVKGSYLVCTECKYLAGTEDQYETKG